MFLGRREVLLRYSAFLWPVLESCEVRLRAVPGGRYPGRWAGFVAERLHGYWLEHVAVPEGVRLGTLPLAVLRTEGIHRSGTYTVTSPSRPQDEVSSGLRRAVARLPAPVLLRAHQLRRARASEQTPVAEVPGRNDDDEGRAVRRLYLIGSSGFPNFGDEAIARAWIRWLATNHPDDEVWLDCPWPGSASVLLGDEHPRLRFVDTLFEVLRGAASAWEAVERVTRALGPHGPGASRLHGLRALAQADVVHMIGGGYANGLWPHHVGLLAAVTEIGRQHGATTAMTGQGVTPLPPDAVTLLRRLAESFDVVDVRDEPSGLALGVAASGDDLFLNPASAVDHEAIDAPSVVVVVQSDLHNAHTSIADAVLQRLIDWEVPPAEIAFLECIPGVDRPIFDLLAPLLPGCRFIPFVEVWDRGMPVREGQRWVSTRFHPHLLAALGGASGVALSVHPEYYDTKHGSLTRLGSGWHRASPGAVLPEVGPPGSLAGAAAELREVKEQLAMEIYGLPAGRGEDPTAGRS